MNARGSTRKQPKSSTPEYAAWAAMIQRCSNPNHPAFPSYGGRGITVCAEWRTSFDAFRLAVGRRTSPLYSIDRIDNNRGYEPGNLRWASRKIQRANQRPRRIYRRFCARCCCEMEASA